MSSPTLADAFAEIATLRLAQAQDRARIARLEQQTRKPDYALMAELVRQVGLGRAFTVDELLGLPDERDEGRTTLVAAIQTAVGDDGCLPIKFGRWLAARADDPLGGIRVRSVGKAGNSARWVLEPA